MESKELANIKTGEIIEVEQTPNDLLLSARDAARALETVIQQNDRPPVMFNGKRHLEYPHWQTVAKFYHCTVATKDEGFMEIDGVKGFKASATVIDERTGSVVGTAEAYCMRDERNWKEKPLFQLSSMAQTRAGAKALSNKFRYVAIVAGYEPTPSEEMTNDQPQKFVEMPKAKSPRVDLHQERAPADEERGAIFDRASEAQAPFEWPEPASAPAKTFGDPEKPASEKQKKMIWAVCQKAGVGEKDLKAFMFSTWKIESSKDLLNKHINEILAWVKRFEDLNG